MNEARTADDASTMINLQTFFSHLDQFTPTLCCTGLIHDALLTLLLFPLSLFPFIHRCFLSSRFLLAYLEYASLFGVAVT
jgi:hypothetical protein